MNEDIFYEFCKEFNEKFIGFVSSEYIKSAQYFIIYIKKLNQNSTDFLNKFCLVYNSLYVILVENNLFKIILIDRELLKSNKSNPTIFFIVGIKGTFLENISAQTNSFFEASNLSTISFPNIMSSSTQNKYSGSQARASSVILFLTLAIPLIP
jgi:hypothetical protein